MPIIIKKVRISNFRSLSCVETSLGLCNVLIGQNNCGKSNFLRAIDIALSGARSVSEQDIFVKDGERLASDKSAIIDVLIIPTEKIDARVQHFSEFWTGVFTDRWVTTDETEGDFVGIRTIISYDIKHNDYSITRRCITEWGDTIEEAKCGKKQQFGLDIMDYINSFSMDAHRDISDDIKNKKSYIGKATSASDLPKELVEELENRLDGVNEDIINNIPSLKQTSDRIAAIGGALGSQNSSIKIEPLARKIGDLHKGMDVSYRDGAGAFFSVSQHGSGTRSWISFLTLGAYVDWFSKKIREEETDAENFVVLTMEEPEAHLHPQAQRRLYSQIMSFNGQKIISTHSPNVLAQAEMADIMHFFKTDGETKIARFNMADYTTEDVNRIKREVINTRGDILFAYALVLCEGITEEQALPIYFKEYFGFEPVFCGINIIGIGGQNYKSFLKFIKDLGIRWFIFSDGEPETIKTVKNAVKVMSNSELISIPNVVILDNSEDYEKHLLASGYGKMMIDGINESHKSDNLSEPRQTEQEREMKTYFEKFCEKHNHTSCGRFKTDKQPCKTCGQQIYEDKIREYDGSGGLNSAIYDCCTCGNAKARYAQYIAQKIVETGQGEDKIPPKVRALFKEISSQLNIPIRSGCCEGESIKNPARNS